MQCPGCHKISQKIGQNLDFPNLCEDCLTILENDYIAMWNDVIEDDQQTYRKLMMQLHAKGIISTTKLFSVFDIDCNQEMEQIRNERAFLSSQAV